jgi:DNA-binding transcriptional regulator YiaG
MKANEIKKYRTEARMSVGELALKLDVKEITVLRWERGERKPASIYLKTIRQILNRKLEKAIPE